MSDDLPNYFDSFEPNRVELGDVVSRAEMIRRLAHFLQVPQKYGNRLYTAFESVISDALMHGEGIKIRDAGHLSLVRHKTDEVQLLGEMVPRVKLYNYKWAVSKDALAFLMHLSELDRKGVISDYLSNPEDPKLQINKKG